MWTPVYSSLFSSIGLFIPVLAHLGDIVDSVPDLHNKASIEIKQVIQIYWFPSACKIYAYVIP